MCTAVATFTSGTGWFFGPRRVSFRRLASSPPPLGFDPRDGSYLVGQDFPNAPDMIRSSRCHRRGTCRADMLGPTQFVMRKAQIVGASNQIHAGFQCL